MRKIAVTGNFASGKSTVCRLLQEYGAYVVDADKIVHELLTLGSPIGEQVVKLLGPEIIIHNQIDRKKISNIVFSNPEKLKALEAILHPAVRFEIQKRFNAVKDNNSYCFFVAEVPLLDEANMANDFDTVIAVVTDTKTARQRTADPEKFDQRIRFQLPQTVKQSSADFVIMNQGDLSALKAKVSQLISKLRSIDETR